MTEADDLATTAPISAARKRVSTLSRIAFGVSLVVSTGLWVFFAAAATGDISDNSDLLWPEPFAVIAQACVLSIFLLAPAIALDIVAGVRGGRSRALALAGGVVLASSGVYLGMLFLISALAN